MYRVNQKVFCTDGQIGKLIKIAVDPKTYQLTDLIIDKGFLQKKVRAIPVTAVKQIDDNGIHLSFSSQALVNYPEYREEKVLAPLPDRDARIQHYSNESARWNSVAGVAWTPTPPDTVQYFHTGVGANLAVIGQGTRVYYVTEPVGQIDGLAIDTDSHRVNSLIVRWGVLGRRFIVPIHLIDRMNDQQVYILAPRQDLKAL
ncbi:MAG TPA: hypothetical protein P5526_20060 [Anaerolineae bacterium]|nr:hypothetical protein [Anaerolineae bacterium]HRV94463.1 hypothetical protein [Anaerolineae bacterium]